LDISLEEKIIKQKFDYVDSLEYDKSEMILNLITKIPKSIQDTKQMKIARFKDNADYFNNLLAFDSEEKKWLAYIEQNDKIKDRASIKKHTGFFMSRSFMKSKRTKEQIAEHNLNKFYEKNNPWVQERKAKEKIERDDRIDQARLHGIGNMEKFVKEIYKLNTKDICFTEEVISELNEDKENIELLNINHDINNMTTNQLLSCYMTKHENIDCLKKMYYIATGFNILRPLDFLLKILIFSRNALTFGQESLNEQHSVNNKIIKFFKKLKKVFLKNGSYKLCFSKKSANKIYQPKNNKILLEDINKQLVNLTYKRIYYLKYKNLLK